MAENLENLVLEQLRAVRVDNAKILEEVRGLRTEIISVRHHVRGIELTNDQNGADVAALKLRIERVERRLELADS